MQTIETQYAEQFVNNVVDREYVVDAELAENRKGTYVKVLVKDKVSAHQIYNEVDDHPIWIEVEVQDES